MVAPAAADTKAQYDNEKQILTYAGKQYTWNPQAQVSGQGTVVSAPSMAVGSRNMGSTNVELNADGTFTATKRSPAAAPAAAPAAPAPPPAVAPPAPAPAPGPVERAVAASGQPDDVSGVDAQVAANAAATPAAPINRDAMTFKQAFADARAKGEQQFTWKGKPYAVKLAPAKKKPDQGAMAPQTMTQMPGMDIMGAPLPAGSYGESKEYNELERLVSLVHYR